jgi:hypothetical protein
MRHVGVIVENGSAAGLLAIPRMVQAVMIRRPQGDGCKDAFRDLEPGRLLEHHRNLGERGNGEPIPVGNDLVVAAQAASASPARRAIDRIDRGTRLDWHPAKYRPND